MKVLRFVRLVFIIESLLPFLKLIIRTDYDK